MFKLQLSCLSPLLVYLPSEETTHSTLIPFVSATRAAQCDDGFLPSLLHLCTFSTPKAIQFPSFYISRIFLKFRGE